MKVLINERLSQHKYKTPEGYLICQDAILARTGKQTYTRGDVFGQDTRDAEADIEVDRKYEEVFSPKTLASFENKPITVEHPDEDVNVDNYKDYAVGFVRDVKQGKTEDGEDVILGTLVITDAQTIKEIENGEHTELSCGYDCDIIDEENPQQRNIRGNHVALCEHGRAGIAKIVDSEKIKDSMMYKGYKLEETKYLHNEEIGAKIAITKNGIIVGGADSYEEAKSKIDNMKTEKDLYYKDSFDDSIKDIHRIYLYYLVSAGGAHVDNRGRLRYDGGEDTYKLYESIEEARKDLDEYQRKLGVRLYIEKDIFLDDSIKDGVKLSLSQQQKIDRYVDKLDLDEQKVMAEINKRYEKNRGGDLNWIIDDVIDDIINNPRMYDSIDDATEKNYKIYVKNAFGAYKVCDWPAVSKEAAVKEFLESNPAYKNKGIIEARDSINDSEQRKEAEKRLEELYEEWDYYDDRNNEWKKAEIMKEIEKLQASLKTIKDYDNNDMWRIVKELDKKKTVITEDPEIAKAYEKNNNPYKRYKVTKVDKGWRIDVVDSSKKYEVSYKDSKGDIHIQIIRASSLPHAFIKAKNSWK